MRPQQKETRNHNKENYKKLKIKSVNYVYLPTMESYKKKSGKFTIKNASKTNV